MEENTSMSKYNKLKKDHTNGWRAKNKALGEFSWPPTSYSCTFCKREFRSAQALGGHMNAHRREKARLRQITPCLHPQFQHLSSNSNFLDSNPNPIPNIKTCFASNTSSFPKVIAPFTYSSCLPFSDGPCHHLCPPTSGNFYTLRSRESNLIDDGFDDFFDHDKAERMIVKKSKTDLFAELKFNRDLDLELRLGCS